MRASLFLVVALCACVAISVEAKEKCKGRGLVLSGGGDKGAYQAGALRALADKAKEPLNWQYVAGVSVGAINGMAVSQFPIGEEKKAGEFVTKMWSEVKRGDVYKNWTPGREAQGLTVEQGIYNSKPLRDFLKKTFDPEALSKSGRTFNAGAVAVESGDFVFFKNGDPDLLDGVLASAAEPLVFLPIKARGLTWMDGGIRSITPISRLIESVTECDLMDIDVVICHPEENTESFSDISKSTTIPLNMRVLDILENNANRLDMLEARYKYPDVKLRIVSPLNELKTKIMEFDHDDSMRMSELGYMDASNILEGKPRHDANSCTPNADPMEAANRSQKVTLINKSSKSMRLFGNAAEDDCYAPCLENKLFKSMPCHDIKSGDECTWGSHSCKTLRGTDGHAYYRVNADVTAMVKVTWDVPYLGSRKYTCTSVAGIGCSYTETVTGNHSEVIFTFSDE